MGVYILPDGTKPEKIVSHIKSENFKDLLARIEEFGVGLLGKGNGLAASTIKAHGKETIEAIQR